VADSGIQNLDTDFVSLWRGNFNFFDRQWLASFPGNGSFALDNLTAKFTE